MINAVFRGKPLVFIVAVGIISPASQCIGFVELTTADVFCKDNIVGLPNIKRLLLLVFVQYIAMLHFMIWFVVRHRAEAAVKEEIFPK